MGWLTLLLLAANGSVDGSYVMLGVGSCWDVYRNHAARSANAAASSASPSDCHAACLRWYGNYQCAGFDTRAGCQIYSNGGNPARAITQTKNCATNGGLPGCDSWNGGTCYTTSTVLFTPSPPTPSPCLQDPGSGEPGSGLPLRCPPSAPPLAPPPPSPASPPSPPSLPPSTPDACASRRLSPESQNRVYFWAYFPIFLLLICCLTAESVLGRVRAFTSALQPRPIRIARSLSRRVKQTEEVPSRRCAFRWHGRSLLASAAPLICCICAALTTTDDPLTPSGKLEVFCQGPDFFWTLFVIGYTLYLLEALILPYVVLRGCFDCGGFGPGRAGSYTGCMSHSAYSRASRAYAIFEALFSSTLIYLSRRKTSQDAAAYFQRARESRPIMRMHAECWHTILVDNHGNTRSAEAGRSSRDQESGRWRSEKVVTFDGHRDRAYASWGDASGKTPSFITAAGRGRIAPNTALQWAGGFPRLLQLTCTLTIEPYDEETRASLIAAHADFMAETQARDKNMKFTEEFLLAHELHGSEEGEPFERRMLLVDGHVGGWWAALLHPLAYALMAVCMLSWPVSALRLELRTAWSAPAPCSLSHRLRAGCMRSLPHRLRAVYAWSARRLRIDSITFSSSCSRGVPLGM